MLIILLCCVGILLMLGLILNNRYLCDALLVTLVFALPNIYFLGVSLIIIIHLLNKRQISRSSSYLFLYKELLYLLIVATFSFLYFNKIQDGLDAYRVNSFSPYVKLIIITAILSIIIQNIYDLKRLIRIYFILVFVEVCVTGLTIYYNLNIELIVSYIEYTYRNLKVENTDLSEFILNTSELKRFHSNAVRNGVNIVAYLYPLVFFPLINRGKIYGYFISAISLYLLMLTWSRTGILAILVTMSVYFYSGSLKERKNLTVIIVIVFTVLIYFADDIITRIDAETRLSSTINIETRINMMSDYLSFMMHNNPFAIFVGNNIDVKNMHSIGLIQEQISSENLLIDTFLKRGVIGVIVLITILLNTLKKAYKISEKGGCYGVYLFSIYFTLIIIANTYMLYHYDLHLWILIIIIHILFKLSVNNELRDDLRIV